MRRLLLATIVTLLTTGCMPNRDEVHAGRALPEVRPVAAETAQPLAAGQFLRLRSAIPDEVPGHGFETIRVRDAGANGFSIEVLDETPSAKDRTVFRFGEPAAGSLATVIAIDDPAQSSASFDLLGAGDPVRRRHLRATRNDELSSGGLEGDKVLLPGAAGSLVDAPGARNDPRVDAIVRMAGPAALPRMGAVPRRTVCVPGGTFSAVRLRVASGGRPIADLWVVPEMPAGGLVKADFADGTSLELVDAGWGQSKEP